MIPRYALAPMAELFADEARYATWLEVELLAVEAQAKLGVIPADAAAAIRDRAGFTVEAIEARERVTDHDVAAFVDVVQERVGPPHGAWVHHGLTSSDVVDTALSVTLVRATDLLLGVVDELDAAIVARAREHRATPMAGRTHGIHAEPTTFGAKLALWALQLRRDRARLVRARSAVAVGKLSGAVGTYSNVDPEVEAFVCDRLGLEPVPATQVIARDRHAELLYACASLGAGIETAALEIRHLQRTEVREVEEPFRTGEQKGSSAMPHKRNPVKCEQLCGLARVLRAYVQPGLEDIALWHERDISHSSVERIVLPDSLQLAYYLCVRFRAVAEGMVVYPDRMRANLDASHGLVFSQPVLLALVESGMTRDDAYRVVQRDAARTWEDAPTVPRRPRRRSRGRGRPRGGASRRLLRPRPSAAARRPRGRPALSVHMTGIALPHHYTGKVRDLYDVDHDRMLVVASDRISVFDVVLPDEIPDKGRALTALSTFWFEQTASVWPNHLVSSDPTDFPETAGPEVAGRAMLVRAARPVRLECIARGYLFGSAWSEYEAAGTVGGRGLPSGLRQAERLPEPLFTTTTKAETGHDEPLNEADADRARR